MKRNVMFNVAMIVFSVLFTVRVMSIFTADRFVSLAVSEGEHGVAAKNALGLLDIATKIDSTNADIYYRQYDMLRGESGREVNKRKLALLRKCIALRPFWPKYHFSYAIALAKMSEHPNIITRQLTLSELKKASELKPYSYKYHEIWQKYLKIYK